MSPVRYVSSVRFHVLGPVRVTADEIDFTLTPLDAGYGSAVGGRSPKVRLRGQAHYKGGNWDGLMNYGFSNDGDPRVGLADWMPASFRAAETTRRTQEVIRGIRELEASPRTDVSCP